MHTGSYVDPTAAPTEHAAAMRQVREGLLPLLDAIADDAAPWLLLEPTAGQGRSLCAGVEDLAPYLDALDHHPKAGICLDTCHVFAAGAPLDEPGGATATARPDRRDRRAGPAAAGARQRLDGRARRVQGPAPEDRRGPHRRRRVRASCSPTRRPTGCRSSSRRPGSRDPGNAGHPAAQEAAGVRREPDVAPARSLATLALLAITACWGSTFFLIKDLLDRVPTLDFLAVRFAIAGRAACSSSRRGRSARLTADVAPARARARRAVRRRPDPADRRARAHRRRASRASSPGMYVVATPLFAAAAAAHPDHRA